MERTYRVYLRKFRCSLKCFAMDPFNNKIEKKCKLCLKIKESALGYFPAISFSNILSNYYQCAFEYFKSCFDNKCIFFSYINLESFSKKFLFLNK